MICKKSVAIFFLLLAFFAAPVKIYAQLGDTSWIETGFAEKHVITSRNAGADTVKVRAMAVGNIAQGPSILFSADISSFPYFIRQQVAKRIYFRTGIDTARIVFCLSGEGINMPNAFHFYQREQLSVNEMKHLVLFRQKFIDTLEALAMQALAAQKPCRLQWNPVEDGSPPALAAWDIQNRLRGVVYGVQANKNKDSVQAFANAHNIRELLQAQLPDVHLIGLSHFSANDITRNFSPLQVADKIVTLLNTGRPLNQFPIGKINTLKLPYSNLPGIAGLQRSAENGSIPAKYYLDQLVRGKDLPDHTINQLQVWLFGKELTLIFSDYILGSQHYKRNKNVWLVDGIQPFEINEHPAVLNASASQRITAAISHLLLSDQEKSLSKRSVVDTTAKKIRIKIRIEESDTRKSTPAMVCMINLQDSQVYVPPYGTVAEPPSTPGIFMKGVEFSADRNWRGPVRMMNGMGGVNAPRTYVYGTLPAVPHYRELVVYQTSGNFDMELYPGKWQINILHGNEYVPVKQTFDISASDEGTTKTFLLKRWIDMPARGWFSGDVHVHHPTYKKTFRDYLLAYGKAENLHVLNMLEMGHHTGTEFKVNGFGKEFRVCEGNTCLVSGQEDPRSEFGHIIGLNLSEQVRDTSMYNYYDLVFEKLQLQPGAVVGFAHFATRGDFTPRGFPMYVTTGNLDFVELLQKSRINILDYYDYLNLGFRISAAAGSDFPWGSTIGDVRTYVYCGKKFSLDAWFAGLKAGNTFVTNGPALFFEADGRLPGTPIKKKKNDTVQLTARAFSDASIGVIEKVELYNNSGLIATRQNAANQDSLRLSIHHIIRESQWIAAVVYCTNGAVAHTTPVYYSVDGRPHYDTKKGPLIIDKQLAEIEKVNLEERAKVPVDTGILERLEKAKQYYIQLAVEMRKH